MKQTSKQLNKNTDNYALAHHLTEFKNITEYWALQCLGIKNLSARVSELNQMGLPVESVLKKVVKRNGKIVMVRDYYRIRKGKVGVYRATFKKLIKKCGE